MLKPLPSNPAYLISDSGQVFSTKTNKYLKTHCGKVGYPMVGLTTGKGKRTLRTVHSLVAEAFIGNRPAHNRKQVKCNGVTYASLREACNALDLTASKACVAINKGKTIKGFQLVYA